jgi:hypothetical protein
VVEEDNHEVGSAEVAVKVNDQVQDNSVEECTIYQDNNLDLVPDPVPVSKAEVKVDEQARNSSWQMEVAVIHLVYRPVDKDCWTEDHIPPAVPALEWSMKKQVPDNEVEALGREAQNSDEVAESDQVTVGDKEDGEVA